MQEELDRARRENFDLRKRLEESENEVEMLNEFVTNDTEARLSQVELLCKEAMST